MNNQMTLFDFGEELSEKAVVNVASVPQRSPFRYPGEKPGSFRWSDNG